MLSTLKLAWFVQARRERVAMILDLVRLPIPGYVKSLPQRRRDSQIQNVRIPDTESEELVPGVDIACLAMCEQAQTAMHVYNAGR
jgi:hypothetical protein